MATAVLQVAATGDRAGERAPHGGAQPGRVADVAEIAEIVGTAFGARPGLAGSVSGAGASAAPRPSPASRPLGAASSACLSSTRPATVVDPEPPPPSSRSALRRRRRPRPPPARRPRPRGSCAHAAQAPGRRRRHRSRRRPPAPRDEAAARDVVEGRHLEQLGDVLVALVGLVGHVGGGIVGHGVSPSVGRSSPGSGFPRTSASTRRPRAIRERTVPGGMSSTAAISA